MKNRRVFHYGYEFDYSSNRALKKTEPIPIVITAFITKLIVSNASLANFKPDQVTVNVYEPGQGIPPHVDTHSAFEEPIVSLSLFSDVVLELRNCANLCDSIGILLPRRSLMIMKGASRYRYKHG